MKAGKRIVAAALGGALCLAANAGLSADAWTSVSMTPLGAASLDVGSKHVVSFFLNADGMCKLTLMIAEATSDESNAQASRLQIAVNPGKSARFDTAEGKSLAFACKSNATAMIVTKIDRLASYPATE